VLVYDITNAKSFDQLKYWLKTMNKVGILCSLKNYRETIAHVSLSVQFFQGMKMSYGVFILPLFCKGKITLTVSREI